MKAAGPSSGIICLLLLSSPGYKRFRFISAAAQTVITSRNKRDYETGSDSFCSRDLGFRNRRLGLGEVEGGSTGV